MRLLLIVSLCLTALIFPNIVRAADTASSEERLYPALFRTELVQAKSFVDGMIGEGVVVPLPKDPGGGYTHEQHKRNYRAIYLGGQLYSITGDARYREYVRQVLLAYAEMYPALGEHPAKANQNVGRLFWQVLNDAMWLVHAVQGYGEIRDSLAPAERQLIDDNLFRPAVHFLSVESQATFDRIHNHATWATAGVGMTGYLLGDQDMVDRALFGSDKSGDAGFLRQADMLFSPDGYYTEGPYYQRFALLPFMVFADAIERNDPQRKIFEFRDGILLKALRTTIQLSYAGYFFPFNDAIRDKNLRTAELYDGVAIAYAQTRDPTLLSIAEFQGRTVLSDNGLLLANDLAGGLAQPFPFRSLLLTDGPTGELGAVAILRQGEGKRHTALIAKNSSQGMGHGHFDKLSWQLYDNGHEIVSDYGAARFLNIEAKEGGRYLPENESWAKQTIAHNTLVVDEKSHFGGDQRIADKHAPTQIYFDETPGLQVSSARIDTAYQGVTITRTLALVDIPGLESPTVIDVVRAESEEAHLYDLPLHFQGHLMEENFAETRYLDARPVLGGDHGYQHIWIDAAGTLPDSKGALTWLLDGRFYTYRFASDGPIEAMLGESGANDPNFNLRREAILILRANRSAGPVSFASMVEAHGSYDGATEQTVASRSRITDLEYENAGGKDIVTITLKSGTRFAIAISHNPDPAAEHHAKAEDQTIGWRGFAAVVPIAGEEK